MSLKKSLGPPYIRPISQFVSGKQHVHPKFSDNIAYPLTRTVEKPSVHAMNTGSNSKITLSHQQIEND